MSGGSTWALAEEDVHESVLQDRIILHFKLMQKGYRSSDIRPGDRARHLIARGTTYELHWDGEQHVAREVVHAS